MKNTKKVTAIFLGAFLLTLGACQRGPKKEEPTEHNGSENQESVSPPEGIISLEESKSLYDNYTKHRLGLIQQYEAERSPEEKFEASRFTSFTYSDIKQYMAFIEQQAKDAQVDISSLRIYFANYPDSERFPDGKKVVHPRQNSIFIVPTMKIDGQDYGFYIGEDGKAKLIKDVIGEKGMGATNDGKEKAYASFAPNFSSSAASIFAGTSLTLNHGGSGPPPSGDF
ncbi:MAG: hypothetical protein R2819_03255 [Allomuricauda sp.]